MSPLFHTSAKHCLAPIPPVERMLIKQWFESGANVN